MCATLGLGLNAKKIATGLGNSLVQLGMDAVRRKYYLNCETYWMYLCWI